jgi:hypothetical protein
VPDYKSNDPRGWCGDPSRGAALGRATINDAPRDFAGTITVCRSYLDSGGYDANGTYFGFGAPLWWYADEEGEIDAMLRAMDFEDACLEIQEKYPKATFVRGEDIEPDEDEDEGS